jgi:hypothetical protein
MASPLHADMEIPRYALGAAALDERADLHDPKWTLRPPGWFGHRPRLF